jgi:hypothetical protein
MGKFHPYGQTSPLGTNFTPRSKLHPLLGAKSCFAIKNCPQVPQARQAGLHGSEGVQERKGGRKSDSRWTGAELIHYYLFVESSFIYLFSCYLFVISYLTSADLIHYYLLVSAI